MKNFFVKNAVIISAIIISTAAASWAASPAPKAKTKQEPQKIACIECHSEKADGKNVHPAVAMGCETCHSAIDAADIPHKITSDITKGLYAKTPDICFDCHDKAKIAAKKNIHPPIIGGMCTSCHDPHVSDNKKLLKAEGAALCYGCHKKENFYGPIVHNPVSTGDCIGCHEPHQSDNDRLLNTPKNELCFNCHDKSAFTEKKGSVHKPVADGLCAECHNPHASQNEFLVIRKGNIICRKCHAAVERAPHAVSGFAAVGHPVRGKTDPKRAGKTFGCLSCHMHHNSDSPRLFRYPAASTFDLCVNCHKM